MNREMTIRRAFRDDCTPGWGKVTDGGKILHRFYTLELPWKSNSHNISCIPAGIYTVVKIKPTEKRPYFYFWVKDVPGRDGILMHRGNYTRDLRGCLLGGDSHKDLDGDDIVDVTNTTGTLKILTDLMPDSFKLHIR